MIPLNEVMKINVTKEEEWQSDSALRPYGTMGEVKSDWAE